MPSDPIRVFWVPGCSACVKTKEFLANLGVPFESVNLLENEQGAADLARLGARSVPVVSRGNEFVFGQSLDQVAEFVGKSSNTEANRLAPEELVRRWGEFLEIALSMVTEIPAAKLDYRPIPNRDRTLRELAYHIFQVPDVFVRNASGEFEDWAHYVNLPVPDDVRTCDDILAYARRATAGMTSWWNSLDHKDCLWTVATHYGERPCWEILERQTWHSAQHIRQLQAVLEGFDIPMKKTAGSALYDGLPMPKTLWQ